MKETDKEVVLEFKRRLTTDLASLVSRILVYGSRARGTGKEDSDLDLLVLLRKKNAILEQELEDIAYQVMWDYDFKPIISLKVFPESRFLDAVSKGFSFYKHIQKEGIPI